MSTPDYPDWGDPAAIAASIATGNPGGKPGGTPLLTGWTGFVINTSQVITFAGGPYDTGPVAIANPGYCGLINVGTVNASSAAPWVSVECRFIDKATGSIVGRQLWTLPGTTATAGRPYTISGPTRGDTIRFIITNNDVNFPITVKLQVGTTTQHIARDDWRSVPLPTFLGTVPGFTQPAADPLSLHLGYVIPTALAANTQGPLYLIPGMYAGQAYLTWTNSAQQPLTVVLEAYDAPSFSVPTVYEVIGNSQPAVTDQLVTLPRAPCVLFFTNTGTLSTNIGWSLIAQEYAS